MTTASYYYTREGEDKPVGPVSLQELRALAANGKVRRDTPVIRHGDRTWARYGDLQSAERATEIADRVVDRGARVAAALQKREVQSFGLGLLIGLVRYVTLPWDVITGAVNAISMWGAEKLVRISPYSVTSSTLGSVAVPIFVLLWTLLWVGDTLSMLIVGRPSFSFALLGGFGSFLTLGTTLEGSAEVYRRAATAAMEAGVKEVLTVHGFAERIGWSVKIAVIGYFTTILIALLGEFFLGLAALLNLSAHKAGIDDVRSSR